MGKGGFLWNSEASLSGPTPFMVRRKCRPPARPRILVNTHSLFPGLCTGDEVVTALDRDLLELHDGAVEVIRIDESQLEMMSVDDPSISLIRRADGCFIVRTPDGINCGDCVGQVRKLFSARVVLNRWTEPSAGSAGCENELTRDEVAPSNNAAVVVRERISLRICRKRKAISCADGDEDDWECFFVGISDDEHQECDETLVTCDPMNPSQMVEEAHYTLVEEEEDGDVSWDAAARRLEEILCQMIPDFLPRSSSPSVEVPESRYQLRPRNPNPLSEAVIHQGHPDGESKDHQHSSLSSSRRTEQPLKRPSSPMSSIRPLDGDSQLNRAAIRSPGESRLRKRLSTRPVSSLPAKVGAKRSKTKRDSEPSSKANSSHKSVHSAATSKAAGCSGKHQLLRVQPATYANADKDPSFPRQLFVTIPRSGSCPAGVEMSSGGLLANVPRTIYPGSSVLVDVDDSTSSASSRCRPEAVKKAGAAKYSRVPGNPRWSLQKNFLRPGSCLAHQEIVFPHLVALMEHLDSKHTNRVCFLCLDAFRCTSEWEVHLKSSLHRFATTRFGSHLGIKGQQERKPAQQLLAEWKVLAKRYFPPSCEQKSIMSMGGGD